MNSASGTGEQSLRRSHPVQVGRPASLALLQTHQAGEHLHPPIELPRVVRVQAIASETFYRKGQT